MFFRILSISFTMAFLLNVCTAQTIIIKPYLQNTTPTQITIMWEVVTDGLGSVYIGDTPFTVDNKFNSSSVIGNSSSKIHTSIIHGLNAETKYYYKIVMEDFTESLVYSFVTPSLLASNRSVQIVAMSDMQRDGSHPNKFKEIVEDGIFQIVTSSGTTDITNLDAVLIPGDLVPTGGTYSQWKDYFFNQGESLFSQVPIYPVLGNHEYYGTGGQANFLKYFTLPTNGPSGMTERTWYKDLSNIRIIGFDSNGNNTEQDLQLSWLDDLLETTCADEHIDFVFAELHHPHLSELWTPGESDFTGEIIELLEAFTTECNKASIHFFGHTHGYSRGQSRDDQHLWVNVATAGGAIDNWGEFPNADYDEFVKSQDEYGFVMIEAEAGLDPSFTLKRYGRGDQDAIEDNVLRDEIIIRNNENGPKTPVNIFPLNDTLSSNCIILQASQFNDNEDTHQGSHWQVASEDDFENTLVRESWKQSENWYNEINTQANDDLTNESLSGLAPNNDYYWRVRYRDQHLKWSSWSTSTRVIVTSVDTISTNLITNGYAENGINGWNGDIEALLNADCGSVTPYEGSHNFAVGGICSNESTEGIAFQNINLSAHATDIDADLLSILFDGYMRNFNGSDLPEAYIEFYDASNNLISTSSSISNNTGVWTQKIGNASIPINCRKCRIVLKGTRFSGTDNDSYFDAFSLYVGERSSCLDCTGKSNIDFDGDTYCSDIDCDDTLESIYPGALEICDLLDNNCDGLADSGDTVRWIGLGLLDTWSDSLNWDQMFPPLPCQYVVIDDTAAVIVNHSYSCRGLKVAHNNSIIINAKNTLLINANNTGSQPCITIKGSMINNGICETKNSTLHTIDLYGHLTNNGTMRISNSVDESIIVRTGAVLDGNGKIDVIN